jgi:exonuclease SbcC
VRPLRLSLKGFTAFRDEQTIDFEGLDLFAIAGPTGSGKSSILDAITYALYGYVDRVGKQVSQLVSQGQPRMAVTLEFAVGERRFRVTRSTPSRGASRILLERWEDGEWRQAGDGADRVRDADAMIERALGLDYAAFTRSVLLPQNKFAEFLVGDAASRRKILTELLGLELFERLRQRAGEAHRQALSIVDANERVLGTEYAGVNEDAVGRAEADAERASELDRRLEEAERSVRRLADRWSASERELAKLGGLAREATQHAGAAERAAGALAALVERLAEAEAEAKAAVRAAGAAAKDAQKASEALAKAEVEWGRAKDLGALLVKAEALAEAREAVADLEAEVERAAGDLPTLEKALAAAERGVQERVKAAETAMQALATAREGLDAAQHADLVAAVRAGVRVGDACPVCGATVTSLPKAGRAPGLERARAALEKAEARAQAAGRELDEAGAWKAAAERDLQEARREHGRLQAELERRRGELAGAEASVASAFAGALPADPAAAVQERLDRLERLEQAARDAAEAASEAKDAAQEAERRRDALAAQVAEERGRLDGLPAGRLIAEARELGVVVPEPPRLAAAKAPRALASAAARLAESLSGLAGAIEERAAEHAAGERALLEEALRAVDGLVEPASSLAELVESAAERRRQAAADAARAAQQADALRTRLENARRMAEEVEDQRGRAARFEALARELRADRIVSFLQLEALQILAAAGSKHLATLSDGRYRLAYAEDEFFVIDAQNGDEQRSARTLSGGESFLASLSLALALSEQVRSLSLTDTARLDSLFLDEGFGTLDPESLEVVVEAIEQLGGDGRMVGVITHVRELAIRLPTRIEVEKSPRGSRLQLVS